MNKNQIKWLVLLAPFFTLTLLGSCNQESKKVSDKETDPMKVHERMDKSNQQIDPSIQKTQVPVEEFVEGDTLNFSQQTPAAFKAQVNMVLGEYLDLKNAFIRADKPAIEKESSAMMAALHKVDDELLTGVANSFWKEKKDFLMEHIVLCMEGKTIEGMRENFVFISQVMVKAVEAFGINPPQTLYVQYCPMAMTKDGKGAYWLSEINEIQNPYMGKQMLTCGETKKVF